MLRGTSRSPALLHPFDLMKSLRNPLGLRPKYIPDLLLGITLSSTLMANLWTPPLVAEQFNSHGTADVIYLHGNIVTGEGFTSNVPTHVSALAIQAGMVLAVGSN